MKFFVVLAAALVLAQGAEAAQTKKTAASARRTKSTAAKTVKKQKTASSSSSATESASSMNSLASSNAITESNAASTSTAKASTTVLPLQKRFGMDFYNKFSTSMRGMNAGGSKVEADDNNVGISFKLTDKSKLYLRHQYTFELPNTGRSAGMSDEMKTKSGDAYIRYQNSEFFQAMGDGSVGGRVTVTLPTGDDARELVNKQHNGKISARATFAKPVNSLFNWDYLIQVGYANMANKGYFIDKADKTGHAANTFVGTGAVSYVQNLGLNFTVGSGFTITQSISTSGAWTNETQDYGTEQSNEIGLGTSIEKSIGPVSVTLGVAQEGNIMPDAPKEERWAPDKFMDDESSKYYLELSMAI
jgi:hypothetical protein